MKTFLKQKMCCVLRKSLCTINGPQSLSANNQANISNDNSNFFNNLFKIIKI